MVARGIGHRLNSTKTGLAGLALAVSCSGNSQSVPGDAAEAEFTCCVPTSLQLDPEATLAAHAGTYQLTMVRPGDAPAAVQGTLVLYPQV